MLDTKDNKELGIMGGEEDIEGAGYLLPYLHKRRKY
jgi:hypothetical protein